MFEWRAESAFGLDPTTGSSANPVTDLSTLKSTGDFTYTRRADNTGLTYTVWASTDLQDWGTEPVPVTEQPGGVVNGVQTVLVHLKTLPTSDPYFIRIKAQ